MIQNDSGIGWRSGCPATYFITERGKKYLRNSFKYLDIRCICGIKEIGLTFGLNFENL